MLHYMKVLETKKTKNFIDIYSTPPLPQRKGNQLLIVTNSECMGSYDFQKF